MNKYFKCLTTGETWPLSPNIIGCPTHPGPYNDLIVEESSPNIDIFATPETPLYSLTAFGELYGFKNIFLKDESKSLTGSFKDRGAEELMEYLKTWVLLDGCFVVSCGNDAISTAAYAQKAGIKCYCYVPQGVNGSKGKLINLYGGELIKYPGSYEDIFRRGVQDLLSVAYNATGGYNPIKEEGIKKISYELSGIPEIVVVPCGNGTLLWSIYKGFKELKDANLIKKLPKLVGVQVKGAAPLKTGLVKRPVASIADGIAASESFSGPKVNIALKKTGGEIITVTEKEIVESLKEIIKTESIIPEPTSAAVFAGVKKLSREDRQRRVVLILSAGGYKNLDQIADIVG